VCLCFQESAGCPDLVSAQLEFHTLLDQLWASGWFWWVTVPRFQIATGKDTRWWIWWFPTIQMVSSWFNSTLNTMTRLPSALCVRAFFVCQIPPHSSTCCVSIRVLRPSHWPELRQGIRKWLPDRPQEDPITSCYHWLPVKLGCQQSHQADDSRCLHDTQHFGNISLSLPSLVHCFSLSFNNNLPACWSETPTSASLQKSQTTCLKLFLHVA